MQPYHPQGSMVPHYGAQHYTQSPHGQAVPTSSPVQHFGQSGYAPQPGQMMPPQLSVPIPQPRFPYPVIRK